VAGGDVVAEFVEVGIGAVERADTVGFPAAVDLGPGHTGGVLADLVRCGAALAYSVAEDHVDLVGSSSRMAILVGNRCRKSMISLRGSWSCPITHTPGARPWDVMDGNAALARLRRVLSGW
jgi:hypothetical protein